MTAKEQIAQAVLLGRIAFRAGQKRVPSFDLRLQRLTANRQVGEVPKGEASSVAIMKAWLESWDHENLTIRKPIGVKELHYVVFDGTSAFVCGIDDITDEEILFKSENIKEADSFCDKENNLIQK